MNKEITIYIDGQAVKVNKGQTILEAARKVNTYIPTLCHHDDLCVAGNCRVCVVEIEGKNKLEASCAVPAEDNMKVSTLSPKVRNARKDIMSLLVSEHNTQCTTCYRNTNCELQDLASEYNVDNDIYINLVEENYSIDRSSWSIEKDPSKCVRCQRCVRTCAELQHVNALTVANKGEHMEIQTFMDLPLNEVVCTNCGQCIIHCPTGALTERRYYDDVWDALGDPEKHVIVNTAPSVRVALGETQGMPAGSLVTGKMVASLRKMGFDSVLDTDFAADLTIIEEGTELLMRLKKALVDKEEVALPMITSCSPGWVKFIEHMYNDKLAHLSTCKSPQQMFGAVAKTYYADKIGVDPKNVYVVAGMPCAAKKYEANRMEMKDSGFQDIDAGLTTREIGHMIKSAGIKFDELENEKFDKFMGIASGAGDIFAATGGVMEAALRTVYEIVTGREVPFKNLEIKAVRGLESVKETSIKFENCLPEWSFLEGIEAKFAVAHGLKNARDIMDMITEGNCPYTFIEIMACPGGCIGGGGQPIPTNNEIRKKRMEAIYREDTNKELRKSHENPEIKQIYDDFLGKPLGEKSHKLLHTHYRPRNRY